jgi:hypothetical protein
VEIGTEAAQFPEKEYINMIFLAVYRTLHPIKEQITDLIQLKPNIILAKSLLCVVALIHSFEENSNVVTLQSPILEKKIKILYVLGTILCM